MVGPDGDFHAFADSYREAPFEPVLFWLAQRYRQPSAFWTALRDADHSGAAFGPEARSLLFAPLNLEPKSPEALCAHFPSADVFSGRTGWTSSDSWFSCKGGDVQAPHAHHDLGSFVYVHQGQRWVDDPGAGDYSVPGYWNGRPDTDMMRWQTWPCGADAHASLLVDGRAANPLARGAIHDIVETDDLVKVSVDLDEAHGQQALKSWTRSFSFNKSNGQLTVCDRVECLAKSTSIARTFPCRGRAEIKAQSVHLSHGEQSLLIQGHRGDHWSHSPAPEGTLIIAQVHRDCSQGMHELTLQFS